MTNIAFLDSEVRNYVAPIYSLDLSEYTVVDIRDEHEEPRLPQNICSHEVWPLSDFSNHIDKIEKDRKYLFFCQAGVRSLSLIEQLHTYGLKNTYSLDGGVFAFQHMWRTA